jgi:hypothetical protein
MSNTEQVIAVLGHENMHATGERSEVVVGRAEDQAMNAWESENAFNGNMTGGGYDSGADFYVSQSDTAKVKQGSDKAAGVEDVAAYQIRTGTVDPGDTLTAITKEVNAFYGTEYTELDILNINQRPSLVFQTKEGEIIRVGTIDENGNTWQPPYEEGEINSDYFGELNENQQKITHYHRRIFEDEDIPVTSRKLEKNEEMYWSDPKDNSPAHNVGTEGNIEYRGIAGTKREGQQVVYDINGNLVTSHENAGSYDYELPRAINLYQSHLDVDVEPWLEYGNSPQDTTTKEQRIHAMAEGWRGRQGLERLGYKENEETGQWER